MDKMEFLQVPTEFCHFAEHSNLKPQTPKTLNLQTVALNKRLAARTSCPAFERLYRDRFWKAKTQGS